MFFAEIIKKIEKKLKNRVLALIEMFKYFFPVIDLCSF